MQAVGLRLRRGAPGGEVAVAHRAQRLAQLLTGRVVAFEGDIPCRAGHLVLVGHPLRPALQPLAHLLGTVQTELGGGGAVAVAGMAHDDPDPVEGDRVEGVLVGQVIADVDWQPGTGGVGAL